MTIPRILISNDDGYISEGLRALADAVSPLGEVWVVAPEAEMAFHRADVGFHEAVAMEGGNRILTCLFEAMAPPLQRSFFMSRRGRQLRGQDSQHTIAAHARIPIRFWHERNSIKIEAGDAPEGIKYKEATIWFAVVQKRAEVPIERRGG